MKTKFVSFALGTAIVLLSALPLRAQFVYVVNVISDNISAYRISSNGVLTQIPGSPFAAGANPSSITVDPTNRFAYLVNGNSGSGGTASVYRIGSNGALTPVPGSPFATIGQDPVSVAVDPTGSYVYLADYGINSGTNGVSGFSIGSNGALTPIPGSPFSTGGEPSSVAVDPTGKFTYVTDFQTDTGVAGYSIGSNGALTPLPGSPFAAEVGASTVAITPYVPFAAFFAKLEIEGGYRPGFEQEAFFILGGNSNGINPVTENVTLQIGTFSVTIPAGSFQQDSRLFRFEGVINGVKLQVQIVSLTNNLFILKANGSGVDLTSLTNPVTVGLTIGIDSGSTEVIARFEKETRLAK